MKYDLLPGPDEDFAVFATRFLAYATAHPGALDLDAADVTRLTAAVGPWLTSYEAHTAARAAAEAARVAKDEARAVAEQEIRLLARIIQADPGVAVGDRVELGLRVHKKGRTRVGVVETHPVLYRVDRLPGQHLLWLSDSATPGRKAKPPGVTYCEIRACVRSAADLAPTDPETMPPLKTGSRTPVRCEFGADDTGQMAYYAQRWVNRRQVPGPWGPVTGWLVL